MPKLQKKLFQVPLHYIIDYDLVTMSQGYKCIEMDKSNIWYPSSNADSLSEDS